MSGNITISGFEAFELSSDQGNDSLTGAALNDVLSSGRGSDVLTGGGGNDTLDGGIEYDRSADADRAVYSGRFGDYSFARLADGRIMVTDLRASSPDGTDVTKNIEVYEFSDGQRGNSDVVAPIVRPTVAGVPKSILPDYQISTLAINSQVNFPLSGHDVTALAGGQFLVTWTTDRSADTETDIKARIVNADGSMGAIIDVNTAVAGNQSEPDAVRLGNGNLMLAWRSAEGATGDDIRARIFDADGSGFGNDYVLNAITPDTDLLAKDQFDPLLLALKDGSVLATWQSAGVFDESYNHDSSGIQARYFSTNGFAKGEEFQIEAPSHSHYQNLSLSELNDGRVLLTADSSEPTQSTKTSVITRDGKVDGFVNSGAGFALPQGMNAVVLEDGRIVATFQANRIPNALELPTDVVMAQIIAADGTPENLAFLVGRSFSAPSLTALRNGHFAITWTGYSEVNSFDIRMRVYNADGTAAGPDFVVNSTTAGRQTLSKVVELSDGKIAVTWESTDANEITTIRGTVIDLGNSNAQKPGGGDQTGTELGETLTGDDGANVLLGNGGDDLLFGGGSVDTLRGGTGRDELYGGDGADRLFGEAGTDKLYGGRGSDSLNGGKGVDRYLFETANEGPDVIAKFEKGEKIVVDGEAFGFGTLSGKLAKKHFKSGTTKKAGDSNDFFIFRVTDDTLWFDKDGKGGKPAVELVELTNNFDLAAGDILLV
jgi:Ca2+-binding RTX toxin-like protein